MTLVIPDAYSRMQRDVKAIEDPLGRHRKDLQIIEEANKIQEQTTGIGGLVERNQRRAWDWLSRLQREIEIIESYRVLLKAVTPRVSAHGNVRAKVGAQSKGKSTTRKSAKSESSSSGDGGGDGDGDGPPPQKPRPRKPRAPARRNTPPNTPSNPPSAIVVPPPPPPPQPPVLHRMNPHVPIFGMLSILLLVVVLLDEKGMVSPILVLMGNSIGKLTDKKSKGK